MQIEHSSQFVKARHSRRVVGYLMQKYTLRGRPPPIIFARIVRPMNAIQLCLWHCSHEGTCSWSSSSKVRFKMENGRFAFFWAPFGGLWTTYDVYPAFIEKRVVDFLLVLIEHFPLGVTAETLRAKINRKAAISLQRGHFDRKFQVEGIAPSIIFAQIVRERMSYIQLCCWQLTIFTQRNFVADILQANCDFKPKTAVLRFWAPFRGLGATYDDRHLRSLESA